MNLLGRQDVKTYGNHGSAWFSHFRIIALCMIVFSGIKPYLCDICGYGTNLRVKMDLHMATKHNEDKILAYVCEVCDYKCSNQLHLRAHLQIVHLEGLTPFECGVSISKFYN